ncbi:hypothetical protein NMG60_11001667 [Bertholletia excelsa]
MAKLAAEPVCLWTVDSNSPFSLKWKPSRTFNLHAFSLFSTIRASQFQFRSESLDDKSRVFKELGMFSLRKEIEDAVLRAETLASTALEVEEAMCIKQQEMVRQYNLWDDLAKSNEVLVKLADSYKIVAALKDVQYKAEEAKLITQLAEMDAINYGLFKQAYTASLDVSKFLDKYEMSKLLRGPYDVEGACMIIKAGHSGFYSEVWADQLLRMYMKWTKKQGIGGRVVEKCISKNGGIKSAIIEIESRYAHGYLAGERGAHYMISSSRNTSASLEASMASVDVIPLFLETAPDLLIDDEDLLVSLPSYKEEQGQTRSTVSIQHIPTGLKVQSSGERSHFANKIKTLNRLKAKLLVVMRDQGSSTIRSIKKNLIVYPWHQQTRRYMFHPCELVQDLKTGLQLPDLKSILDGNIEPLIAAIINSRQASDVV